MTQQNHTMTSKKDHSRIVDNFLTQCSLIVKITQGLQYSRSNRNQELVETSEENVGYVTHPDVGGGAHEKQQTSLGCSDHPNYQLWPDLPSDLQKSCHKRCDRTWDK